MDQVELDREKQNLLTSFEAGEWQSVPSLPAESKRYRRQAKATLTQGQSLDDDLSIDDVLWSFVQQERWYRAAHPEDVVLCDTDEALLAALDGEAQPLRHSPDK
jgi:hypothetical protein